MKFEIGDATDTALCVALKHEFLRCDDAFEDLVSSAKIMIVHGDNRRIAYKTYNAYARFIHHFYEFLMGAATRDRLNTEHLKSDVADRYVTHHTQRILTSRRKALLNGRAPAGENDITYYPERVPRSFAAGFRRCRNVASGHFTHKRSNLNMTNFYDQNHKFLRMLYHDVKGWWGRQGGNFPDLKEITAFSVLLKDNPPSQP